ncbi:MAG: Mth938-like domain-containing protein [Rhodospirillaceae bacterium]|nr:Mth938-like domain-containing protein [Rhodospirillaceae bacterium]
MDVTPLIPAGRQIIETYGDGRFRIANVLHPGSVLVFPAKTLMWAVTEMAALDMASLQPVSLAAQSGEVKLLLLGCGPRLTQVPRDLRALLRADGIVIEPMDTGAAARTFNVLMAEGRWVAAALIAV